MKYVKFEPEDKIAAFDEIASHYYEANFGQMSKADFELMMFRIYLQKMINDNMCDDGTIDYRKCSDYRISQELGITQQRVRNLKVKNQLQHPIEYDWKKALAKMTDNARYDKVSKKIIMNIPDPNLYLEIQNFIEEQGAYVEKQLNSKILQLRVEYYIGLVIELEPEEDRKRIIKILKQHFKSTGKEEVLFDENNIGKSLIDLTADVTTIAANLNNKFSAQNVVASALMGLLELNL